MPKAKFLNGSANNNDNGNASQSTKLTSFIDEAFQIVEDDFESQLEARQDALTDKIVASTYQAADVALGNARARLDREGFVEKFRSKLRAVATVYGSSGDNTENESISDSNPLPQLPSSN